LVERVRARLGRVVLHPHAVHVTAHDGRVELEGPILASEEPILLAATWSVPGVSDIENRLERHDRPDHVPALQGTGRQRMRSWLMQEHWTPALRVAAVVSGTAMALQALRQRGPAGVLLTFLGAALVTRGATNVPLRRAIGVGRGRRAFDVHKVIHVAAAPQTVFDMWKDHENFPRFMSHVCEVRDLGNGRSHWTVKGPAG